MCQLVLTLWLKGRGEGARANNPKVFLHNISFHKLWKRNFGLSKLTPKLIGRCNKITNLAHNFGEEEPKSGRNSAKLIKNAVFSMLLSIFGKRGAHRSSGKCKGGVPMFQGQIGEFSLLSPGKDIPAIFFQNCRKFLQFETPITRQRKLQKPWTPLQRTCKSPGFAREDGQAWNWLIHYTHFCRIRDGSGAEQPPPHW